ncbi:MAG: hypothetical protein KDA78_02810 [Planctomycetaceae bacterium]|nr:hypothetical protein [Planctomycetaceae bacterium]
MNAKFAAGIFAFAALFVLVTENAKAAMPEDGNYTITNNAGDGVVQYEIRLWRIGKHGKDGVYRIHMDEGGSPAYLSAEGSDDGDDVELKGPNKTHWRLQENEKGWIIRHDDNGFNCLTIGRDGLKLKRFQNTPNQFWKLREE